MKKYRIVIVVSADSVDDAEYMARGMLGSAYDSVHTWRVETIPEKEKRRRQGAR